MFPEDVAEEIWEQTTAGGDTATAEELSRTIFDAENIIQSKIIGLNGTLLDR